VVEGNPRSVAASPSASGSCGSTRTTKPFLFFFFLRWRSGPVQCCKSARDENEEDEDDTDEAVPSSHVLEAVPHDLARWWCRRCLYFQRNGEMGAAGKEAEKTDLEDHEDVEVEEEVVPSPVRARSVFKAGENEDEVESAAPSSLLPSPRLLLLLPPSSAFCCSFWFTCSSIAAVNDNRDKSNCNMFAK